MGSEHSGTTLAAPPRLRTTRSHALPCSPAQIRIGLGLDIDTQLLRIEAEYRPKLGGHGFPALIENRQLDGAGVDTLPNGNSYQGQFQNGYIISGTLTVPGKYTVKDPFSNQMPNGNCTITYPDGTTYNGDVVNGVKSGQGTYTAGDHSYTFTGTWKDGKPVNGTMTTKNGQTITGNLNSKGTFVSGEVKGANGSVQAINDNDESEGDSADHDLKGMTLTQEPDGTATVRDNDE